MNLPESWIEVSIGQICDISGGGTPDRQNHSYFGGEIPWATPTDVTKLDSFYLSSTAETLTEDGLQNSSAKLLPIGAVLLTSRATIGKTAIITKPTCTNQGFVNLVCNPDVISNEYLARLLHAWTPYLEARANGATFKEISRSTIAKINILLPTLSEQQRIVDLLMEAERLRDLRRSADTKLSNIKQAFFLEMFGDPVSNPKRFRKVAIGKLIKVKSGEFLPAKDMADNGNYKVYGGNGVNGLHEKYMFEERKIVLGRVGAYCGVVHYTEPKSWITDNALYVSEKFEYLDDHYLVAALELANLNRYAGRAGQPLISASRINPVEILIPPEAEQQKFSKLIVELLRQIPSFQRKGK